MYEVDLGSCDGGVGVTLLHPSTFGLRAAIGRAAPS
jgi:hypothetical protein